ncbi:MAG: hypothetical protein AAF357_08615 [Verrucomicrobiota bacterium]
MSTKRGIAWILIGFAALILLAVVVSAMTTSDPKGTGSLLFAAVIVAAVGWIIGDF